MDKQRIAPVDLICVDYYFVIKRKHKTVKKTLVVILIF